MSATSATPAAQPISGQPISAPLVAGLSWTTVLLLGTVVAALLAYYFIGIDQGMTSVFGNDTHVHEFVHDARHFLGFPCH